MNFKKLLVSGALSAGILAGSVSFVYAQATTYKVQPGDSFWTISQKYNISISSLMKANNATENTVLYVGQSIIIPADGSVQAVYTVQKGDTYWKISQKYGVHLQRLLAVNNATGTTSLNIGDKVVIPAAEIIHTVKANETFWIISQKYNVDINKLMSYNGADEKTIIYAGQKIKVPLSGTSQGSSAPTQPSTSIKPYVTYTSYTVQKGDILWDIANKFGIPLNELLAANNMTESTPLNAGDKLKIPVHHVPIKNTPGEKYGEYLDWWTEAQYVIPVGSKFEVVDFYTGKSFFAKRTTGANHADVETLTVQDTAKMKEIWGGKFSWASRPVIIKYNGRKIAASASSMPHAGNDAAAGGVYVSWRSGDYGAGYNFDWIKGNGIDGVFDIHFLNSTKHKDGKIDSGHQANVKIAAGVK